MFYTRDLFALIFFLHLINASPQINLCFTDQQNQRHQPLQHHFLVVSASILESNINRQIIHYCIIHSIANYTLQNNTHSPKSTFAQLVQKTLPVNNYIFGQHPSISSNIVNLILINCSSHSRILV